MLCGLGVVFRRLFVMNNLKTGEGKSSVFFWTICGLGECHLRSVE